MIVLFFIFSLIYELTNAYKFVRESFSHLVKFNDIFRKVFICQVHIDTNLLCSAVTADIDKKLIKTNVTKPNRENRRVVWKHFGNYFKI